MDCCHRLWCWVKPSLDCTAGPTQAFAGELDAMSVVDETVENGVGVVGSPMISCQRSIGSWDVITAERRP